MICWNACSTEAAKYSVVHVLVYGVGVGVCLLNL